jgi:hypothetical protein
MWGATLQLAAVTAYVHFSIFYVFVATAEHVADVPISPATSTSSSSAWPPRPQKAIAATEQQGARQHLAPVNPKDFGAVGNCTRMQTTGPRCYVDDAPALQRAIDYAQLSGRSLFIPAGIYSVKTPLLVHCTGAYELVHDNNPVKISTGTLCTGVEGPGRWFHPLRISGEGTESTVIIATKRMEAVLLLGRSINVSSSLNVEQLHLDANMQADYGLLSLGVIRSRFS